MKKIIEFCKVSGSSVKTFEGKRRYIATGDVIENKISSFIEVTFDNKPSRANQNVKVGDILFAKMQDTLKVVMIDKQNVNNIYSTGFFAIEPKDNVKSKFLYWLFNSNSFNEQKDKNCKGATQKALNNEGLSKIKIKKLPSLEKQEEIIKKLDKVQEIIDIRKKQIEELDELIKSQFIEMFGDPFNNPNNYKFITFDKFMDRCVDIGSNGANKTIVDHLNMKDKEDYAMLIRTVNFTSNDFVNNMKYIDKEAYEFFSKSKVYGGEIIFNKIGSAGINFIVPQFNRPVSLGLNIIMVTPKEINTRYLYDFLNTEYGKYQIKIRTNGAVTKSIQKTKLKEIPIMYPNIKLQNKYEKFVKQIDKQKFEIQNSLEEIQKLQESLMNKYFG